MTDQSPDSVWYTFEASVTEPGSSDPIYLPVTNITPSMDRDRTTYCEAEITTEWITDDVFALLDPRRSLYGTSASYVAWKSMQWTGDPDDPTLVGQLPFRAGWDGPATMLVRSVTRDRVRRTATIALTTRESGLSDKRRLAPDTRNTGATTVSALVEWSLLDVFNGFSISHALVALSTTIPAGERREMNPEETHQDLMQPELDAIDCRLIDFWGIGGPPSCDPTETGTLSLATYEGVPDTDPIVYELEEKLSRDGDWADGVLVVYSPPGGTTTYVRSSNPGAGDNSRGLVVKRIAPAGRNTAQTMLGRTITRGYDLTITARCRFDVDPYSAIEVHTPDGILTAHVRSIDWDIAESTMTINAQGSETFG